MGSHFNHRLLVAAAFLISSASVVSLSHGQTTGTHFEFYTQSCPNISTIVHEAIKKHFDVDPTIAPALIRMFFHDCFVVGCDGSILLNGPNSEKTAPPNTFLRGYEAIDEAKTNLEKACPKVVSCADILALAARDSVMLTGGFWFPVLTGRRDGRVSLASNVNNLPAPNDTVATQIQKFQALNLNVQDLVTLVGAHTVGTSACQFFSYRLYNYRGTGKPDPSINSNFLLQLQAACPNNGNSAVRVPLDTGSEKVFDIMYFRKVMGGKGVLESDQVLWGDRRTKPVVQNYLGLNGHFGLAFKTEFPKSMQKMGNIGVLTGKQGEIRRVCSATN